MLAKRVSARMVVAITSLLIAVSALTLVVEAPALAAGDGCCRVSIDNLPAQFQAGGNAGTFRLDIANESQATLRYVDVTFVVQATGVVGDHRIAATD